MDVYMEFTVVRHRWRQKGRTACQLVTLQLFQQMQHEGAEADHVALAGVLKACSQLHIGKFIHALLLEKGSNLDDFTGSILMEMYFRLLCPSDAYKIFRMLPKGNIQPWNAIITGSLQNGHLGDAISYFQGMQMENVEADNTTYTIVIKACSDNGQVAMGAMLFSLIIESSRHLSEVVGNALVSMYAKCGSLIDACRLFTKLSKRDAVAWSAIIAGHVLHGFGQEALKFYCQMQLDGKGADNVTFLSALKACSLISALNQGKLIHVQVIDSEWESDVQVGNSLIDMYSKCGKLNDAFMVFYNLPRKTVITWNALIAGLAYNNEYHQALELFKSMQQGWLKPNDATFACLLSACNRLGLVQEGRLLFESLSLIHGVSPKLDHYVCLMESMNRAGFLTDAINLVSILPFAPNLVTWTSLLTNCKAYGVLQLGKLALDFLITTERKYAPAYAIMANFFADVNLLEDANNMQMLRKHAKAWKKPGKAFIEVNNEVYGFIVHDQSQRSDKSLSLKLCKLHGCLKKEDYVPLLDLVLCESCDRSGDP